MTLKTNKTEKKTLSFRLSLNDLAELHRFRQCLQDHNGHLGDRKVTMSEAILTALDLGINTYAKTTGIPNTTSGAWAISMPIQGESPDGLIRLIMAWHQAILGPGGCTYVQAGERAISRLNCAKHATAHYPIEAIDLRNVSDNNLGALTVALVTSAIHNDHGRSLPADDNARIAILRQIWAAADADGVVAVREPIVGPYADPIGRLPDRYAHKDAWVRQQRER